MYVNFILKKGINLKIKSIFNTTGSIRRIHTHRYTLRFIKIFEKPIILLEVFNSMQLRRCGMIYGLDLTYQTGKSHTETFSSTNIQFQLGTHTR